MVVDFGHGVLAHIQLSQENGTGLIQLCHHGGGFFGYEVGQDPWAAGGADTFGEDLVLDRHGYAVHGTAVMPLGNGSLGFAGTLESTIGQDGDVGVELPVYLLDALQVGFGGLDR